MPGLDWIPGISQLKSGFQLVTLDFEGARQTQENFVKECPVVSQVTSVVQLVGGDTDGALETQKRCLGTVNNVANGLPVIGHAKGLVHYIAGDTEGGNQAMNAASRSTAVIGAGVVAGITTGGIASIPAGIAAGAAYDGTATLITDKPQGMIAALDNVRQNPNAGNIFDALFIPVADGMGGYAGGRLGGAVLARARLSGLEAARAAKQGQLDAGLFGEVTMTDAEATSLGQQINAITRQISVIEHGTPQYWFDAKSGQVVKTYSSNSAAVPVAGYIDEKDQKKLAMIVKKLSELQCDAILADDYFGIECAGSYNTTTLKTQKVDQFYSQSPSGSIQATYPNIVVATKEDIQKLRNEKRDPRKKQAKALFDAVSWLAVPMPRQFNYTGAIMRNWPGQGTLHTLLRHSTEWATVIRGFQRTLNSLSSTMQNELQTIGACNPRNTRSFLNNFQSTTRPRLSDGELEVLSDLQMDIYDFLRNNVTYANYQGETVNQAGEQQVHFEVVDLQGNRVIMVVCVSSQLYPADANFNDSRPIRTITTIFFKPLHKAKSITKRF